MLMLGNWRELPSNEVDPKKKKPKKVKQKERKQCEEKTVKQVARSKEPPGLDRGS